MAENKNSIIVYADWIDKFEELTDEEAGKLIKHFFRYVNDQNPVAPDRLTKLAFFDIEKSLKRDLEKWEKRAERSRENGNKGGRPKSTENPEKPRETQQVISKPRKPDSVSDSVSDINKKKGVLLSEFSNSDFSDSELEYFKIATAFVNLFKINKISLGNNNVKDLERAKYKEYTDPIRLLLTNDEYKKSDIASVYDYLKSEQCTFWKPNILSTATLRKKFSQLLIESKKHSKIEEPKGYTPQIPN